MGLWKRFIGHLTQKEERIICCARGDAAKIRRALINGERLTHLDGYTRFNTTKLNSRISDMRKAGMPIKDRWIKLKSGKRCKLYWIEQ